MTKKYERLKKINCWAKKSEFVDSLKILWFFTEFSKNCLIPVFFSDGNNLFREITSKLLDYNVALFHEKISKICGFTVIFFYLEKKLECKKILMISKKSFEFIWFIWKGKKKFTDLILTD